MRRGPLGTYEVTASGGETVSAFIPSPLPPEPPLEFTPARERLHEEALLACGRLDAITALLPEPGLFLYACVRREAMLSSQIEGTQSSVADLLLFELEEAPGVPNDDVIEVSNYVAAMEHGLARLAEGFPLSNRLLREIHERLLSSGRGSRKQPGEFRTSQNWIGGTRPGTAQYVPPPAPHVQPCMANLERFIHDEGTLYSSLVRAALAHVQFETIHPFLDGNGRVGRLLIALLLHHDGVLDQPLLYLSLYLKQHRAEYYRLLDDVRREGDWEAWLDFFLEGMLQTARGAVSTARALYRLFDADSRRIHELGGTPGALRAFNALRARPVTTIGALARREGVSYPTAARSISALARLGVTQELTGRRRNRVFAYKGYLDILTEGAEPL